MSNSAAPGSAWGRPVAPDLPDHLAGGRRQRQVDVAQRDVVREALEQPQRHRAAGRVGRHVHSLVAHHDLGTCGPQPAEDLRVDEDVDRRAARSSVPSAVVVTAAIPAYSPASAPSARSSPAAERRHLDDQARPPAGQHPAHDRHGGPGPGGVPGERAAGPRPAAGDQHERVRAVRLTRTGPASQIGVRRPPRRGRATTTRPPSHAEPDGDLGVRGRRGRSRRTPRWCRPPRTSCRPRPPPPPRRRSAAGSRARRGRARSRRPPPAASAAAPAGTRSRTAAASRSADRPLQQAEGLARGAGPGPRRATCPEAARRTGRRRGRPRRAARPRGAGTAKGRPPTEVGDRPSRAGGQPGRTAPTYGIECSGAVVTPEPGFAACTIIPLPMYMPTWLIGL